MPNASRHISTTLFMDLAFILIAVLVLLVKQPAEEATQQRKETERVLRAKFAQPELPPFAVAAVVEKGELGGETLLLRLAESGQLTEIRTDGSAKAVHDVDGRIAGMVKDGRVVVLGVEPKTPYSRYRDVRHHLRDVEKRGGIARLLECPVTGGGYHGND